MRIQDLGRLFFKPAHRHQAGWFAVCTNSRGVYFAQVQYSGERPQVVHCSFHPVAHVTSSVLEKLRRDERVGNFQFTTLLDASEYQIQLVDGLNVPTDELKTAVRWRIKDSLNYHVDDAAVDVLQIPAGRNGGGRPQSLFAVSAQKDTIRKRIELFEKAKMDLRVIDIPVLAQRNVAELFEEEGRGLALLSFDDSGGILTVTCDGELYMPRRIEITLGQLQDADEYQRGQYLERVALELQRSLDYFGRQFNHIVVQRLLVSAPVSLGLVQALAPNLDVPAEQLVLSQAMDISAAPDLADSEYAAHMFLVLGAALRYERRTL